MNYRLGFQQEISSIYQRHVLVNEVSQKFVDEVKNAADEGQLPFQNIFGDKLRIVIPLETEPMIFDILNAVSKIKDFAGVDLKSGEVTRKIKLDPKYGGGEKNQKINLGRAINALEISEERKKMFLDFIARYKESLADESEFSVVISRSPIDVLRMGEIGNIGHCHQQGNAYFKCAIQEAKTGGGVAFVVKTEDIKKLSEEELQYDDIFQDRQRNIDGITALSRLRIRKYNIYKDDTDDLEGELAIPEIRVYGNVKPNFYDTVLKFLKGAQPEMNNVEEILRKYKNNDIGKAGGSYSDTSDYELFNRAFGGNEFPVYNLASVDKNDEYDPDYSDTDDEDDIEAQISNMEEELQGYENRRNFTSGKEYYGFEVDSQDDIVYYNAWAGIEFEDIPLTFSAEEVNPRKLLDYDPAGEYAWQRNLPYSLKSVPEIALKLKNVFERIDTSTDIHWRDIKGVTFSTMEDSVTFILEDEVHDNPSDYDSMLDTLESIDDYYDDIKKELIKALGVNGLLKSQSLDTYNEIEDKWEFSETLQNTEFDSDDDTLTIKVPNLGSGSETIWGSNYSDDIGEAIYNYLDKYFKSPNPKNTNQMTFDKFFEAYTDPRMKKLYNIESISCRLEDTGNRGAYRVLAEISIQFYVFNKIAADVSRFIDDHIDDIHNLMRLVYLRNNKNTNTPEYKNLFKIYGRLAQSYI